MDPLTVGTASGILGKLIGELPLTRIQAERIALAKEQVQALEKKVAELEKENASLKNEAMQMQNQIIAQSIPDDFVKHHGVLFKRKPTGGYDLCVYCPRCKGPMFSLGDATPFACVSCNFFAGFTGFELHTIMEDLPA